MELLNPDFVFLLLKISVCVLPGVVGLALLFTSEDAKRAWRNRISNQLFQVSNAIPYPNFERGLQIAAILGILFSLIVGWFLLGPTSA